MASLTLSMVEIIVLMLGAIVLGITIHFFITSRRHLQNASAEAGGLNKKRPDEWKLKYFNDIELRDKELTLLRQQLSEAEENSNIYSIEAEEMRRQNRKLVTEMEGLRKTVPAGEKPDYVEQLRQAQGGLMEQNEKISQLLEQVDLIRETEENRREVLKNNEEMAEEIDNLKSLLSQKEKEMDSIRQKEALTREMNAMLDTAYSDFNSLQHKIQKLESQVHASKMLSLEYEDLKEAHYRLSHDFEENKTKLQGLSMQNQQLQSHLTETEDKLREANFQRLQLQKKVAYLEELNNDLQLVSEAHQKLEGQLKRIGELESMLNVVAEERDQLARRRVSES